jgi:hypothetical protein
MGCRADVDQGTSLYALGPISVMQQTSISALRSCLILSTIVFIYILEESVNLICKKFPDFFFRFLTFRTYTMTLYPGTGEKSRTRAA